MESYDILISIFPQLPVKSLLRFRSVSKPWNSIISDEKFKKAHVDEYKGWSSKRLLVQLNDGTFELGDLENHHIPMAKHQFPLKIFRNPTAMCSCHSLVLMKTHMDYKDYALWNPCTNEYRTFECPYLNGMTPHGCGLCYYSSDDDYKVILIYKCFYAVYHVNKNYWTKKTSVLLSNLNARSRECCQGISIDGFVFWSFGYRVIKQLASCFSKIIYFDVKSDELKELPKPNFIGEYIPGAYNRGEYCLTSLEGRLGLYGGSTRSKEFDVWIMEQGGWTLVMKINCYKSPFRDQFLYYENNIMLLGCTKNGEILFQVGRELQNLVIYDPKRHKFTKPVQISEDSKPCIIQICLESFYFPKLNVKHTQEKANHLIGWDACVQCSSKEERR